jgi:hypothetical protein
VGGTDLKTAETHLNGAIEAVASALNSLAGRINRTVPSR